MKFYKEITDCINLLSGNFQENELAYLALTSKIENPLRDKLAFELHQKIGNDYRICREWKSSNKKKTDLAIIDQSDKPVCLIEFKAHSSHGHENLYSNSIKSDLMKMASVSEANNETALYYIFFKNCIKTSNIIDLNHSVAIKYLPAINKFISKNGNSDFKKSFIESWYSYLVNNNLSKKKSFEIEIDAGKYYDLPVSIFAFIYGATFKNELFLI